MIGVRLIGLASMGIFAGSIAPAWPPADSTRAASAEIAFASRRDGNWEIYATDEAGREQRRLTDRDGEDRFPLWSPDRRQIAFCSSVGDSWELWVMDSDGSKQRRLASHIIVKSTRGWSSDSKRIAFTAIADKNADVYAVDVPSGRVTRLTSSPDEDRDPSWSPDDGHVAFSSARDGISHISVMSADGRDVRRLTSGASSAVTPRWSPDGKAVLFVSDADLYVIGSNGQGRQRLTTGAHVTRDPPLWSPDGSRIVFQIAVGENYDIGMIRLSGQVRSLLASSPAYDGSYTWSADGSRVAFVSGRDGVDGIYVVDADSERSRQLTTTASLTPAWGSQR